MYDGLFCVAKRSRRSPSPQRHRDRSRRSPSPRRGHRRSRSRSSSAPTPYDVVQARLEVDVLNAEKIARLGAKVRRHERLQHDKRRHRRH